MDKIMIIACLMFLIVIVYMSAKIKYYKSMWKDAEHANREKLDTIKSLTEDIKHVQWTNGD